ncbi:MAG: nitrate- and nitrite sensing domain-containing protein [Paraglaciecola sp.]|uniref:nitrate- and nitrite sensing domain-containing protein n=1 Tax=Paraglaciecola sp. TaxID=1920173 RepID=UPI003298A67B
MSAHSDVTKRFLLATKRAEINALQLVASNCQVVTTVSELIHQLQKERGISNIFLSSANRRFEQEHKDQIDRGIRAEELLRSQLKAKYLHSDEISNNMRLLNTITLALQGLDYISTLRYKVQKQELTAIESMQAYNQLIKGLLSVVFEAADVGSDPSITKILVALFNFIQGKEYAGQERACGALGFSKSMFDQSLCESLIQLQQAQTDSFTTFEEFASNQEHTLWHSLQDKNTNKQLQQMRTMMQQLADGSAISSEISEVWYELTTHRIDAMRAIEEQLTSRLLQVAKQRVEQADKELLEHKKRVKKLGPKSPLSPELTLDMVLNISADNIPKTYNSQLNDLADNSLYDLLREQSENIKKMTSELELAKQAIAEQKTINRAKLLLMQQLKYNESQAHRALQKQAMDQKVSLAEMAGLIIKVTSGKN